MARQPVEFWCLCKVEYRELGVLLVGMEQAFALVVETTAAPVEEMFCNQFSFFATSDTFPIMGPRKLRKSCQDPTTISGGHGAVVSCPLKGGIRH